MNWGNHFLSLLHFFLDLKVVGSCLIVFLVIFSGALYKVFGKNVYNAAPYKNSFFDNSSLFMSFE